LALVVCEVFLATVVPGMKTMTNSPVSGGSDDSVKKKKPLIQNSALKAYTPFSFPSYRADQWLILYIRLGQPRHKFCGPTLIGGPQGWKDLGTPASQRGLDPRLETYCVNCCRKFETEALVLSIR